MFISSPKTRETKKKLEAINPDGKYLLKNFLERELKGKNENAIIEASKKPKSSIWKFAMLLNTEKNMKLFKEAISSQAKSLGTNNKKGLFNELIFPIRDNWLNSKSKIRAFLRAKEASDIVDNEVDENDKSIRRMKNSSIVEKLKSKRLSNVLKVFIALVMYDYIAQQEEKTKSTVTTNQGTHEKQHPTKVLSMHKPRPEPKAPRAKPLMRNPTVKKSIKLPGNLK